MSFEALITLLRRNHVDIGGWLRRLVLSALAFLGLWLLVEGSFCLIDQLNVVVLHFLS